MATETADPFTEALTEIEAHLASSAPEAGSEDLQDVPVDLPDDDTEQLNLGVFDGEPVEGGQDEDTEGAESDQTSPNVGDDTPVELPDGEKVTLGELRNGYLRQADYTRKTQEAASVRKEAEELQAQLNAWYEERASDPTNWIAEIASESPDPTAVVAQAILSLAKAGKLKPEFVEAFGVESGPVTQIAEKSATEQRIERLEAQLQQEQDQRAQMTQQRETAQRLLSEYRTQWDAVKDREQLRFGDDAKDQSAFVELLKFARDNGITRLDVAYDALARQRTRSGPKPPVADGGVTNRKRNASAITPQGPARPAAEGREPDFGALAREAIAEVNARRGL